MQSASRDWTAKDGAFCCRNREECFYHSKVLRALQRVHCYKSCQFEAHRRFINRGSKPLSWHRLASPSNTMTWLPSLLARDALMQKVTIVISDSAPTKIQAPHDSGQTTVTLFLF